MTLEQYLAQKYSPTAIRSCHNRIQCFKKYYGHLVYQLRYADVVQYIGTLRKDGLQARSLHNHLAAIKIYFQYLVETNQRTDHPCKYLYLKDQVDRQIAVESLYSPQHLAALFENYQSKDPKHQRRNKLVISLLIYQALTVREITALQIQDVDLEKGLLHIHTNEISKIKNGNRSRTLDLKAVQVLLLHQYIHQDRPKYLQQNSQQEKDYLILNRYGQGMWPGAINRIINRNRTKYNRLLPLKIRQSVIANLLKQGNDVRVVQVFAGHRRTASTEAYLQDGLEKLRMAIEQKHPYQR